MRRILIFSAVVAVAAAALWRHAARTVERLPIPVANSPSHQESGRNASALRGARCSGRTVGYSEKGPFANAPPLSVAKFPLRQDRIVDAKGCSRQLSGGGNCPSRSFLPRRVWT